MHTRSMVWGVTLNAGFICPVNVQSEELHLSMVALRSSALFARDSKQTEVYIHTSESTYLLCTLVHGMIYQQALELTLHPHEKLSFSVMGYGTVHITGYTKQCIYEDLPMQQDTAEGDLQTEYEITDIQSEDETITEIPTQTSSCNEDISSPHDCAEIVIKGEILESEEEDTPANTDETSTQCHDEKKIIQDQENTPLQRIERLYNHHVDRDDFSSKVDVSATSSEVVKLRIFNSGEVSAVSEKNTPLIHNSSGSCTVPPNQEAIHNRLGEMYVVKSPVQRSSCGLAESVVLLDKGIDVPAISQASLMEQDLGSRDIIIQDTLQGSALEEVSTDILMQNSLPVIPPSFGFYHSMVQSLSDSNGARQSMRKALVTHKRQLIGHTSGTFKCNTCHKMFLRRCQLKIHEKIHSNNKPYKCKFCHKEFTYNSNRKIHERIHTGLKPFKCHYCEKTFTQSSHLKSHELIHVGNKAFSCTFCNKQFYWSYICKKHEQECKFDPAKQKVCECGKVSEISPQ